MIQLHFFWCVNQHLFLCGSRCNCIDSDSLKLSLVCSHWYRSQFYPCYPWLNDKTPRRDGLAVSMSASHAVGHGFMPRPCLGGLAVSMSASHAVGHGFSPWLRQDGLVVSMSASHAVGRGFSPWPCRDGLVVSMSASHAVGHGFMPRPCLGGLVVSMSTSHAVGHGFASRPGHTKDHHQNGTNCLPALQACIRVRM